MKKCLRIFLAALIIAAVFCASSRADEVCSEFSPEDVPKDVIPYLPEGIFDGEEEDFYRVFSVSSALKTVFAIISDAFPMAIRAFASLLGLTVISSVMGALSGTVASKSFGSFLNYVSAVCVCAAAFSFMQELFLEFEVFISHINGFMGAAIPTVSALMLASGEVSTSLVFGGILSAVVTALEIICTSAVMPLLSALLCVYAVARASGDVDVSAYARLLKSFAAYVLTGMIVVMSCVLTFQSVIAKTTDTAAAKSVKFVLGNSVPIVGGALADAVGTVVSSVGMIRSATGIAGAAIVCVICAVPVIKLLIWKTVFDLLGAAAAAFSLKNESEFFLNMGQITAFLSAVMASISVFFVIALTAAALCGG